MDYRTTLGYPDSKLSNLEDLVKQMSHKLKSCRASNGSLDH